MGPTGRSGDGTAHGKRGLRHRVGTTVPRLSRFAVEHLRLLPLGGLIALAWVNTAPESYYSFTFAIAFAVNDIGMALFFALIMKEIVEATAPAGVLHPWRRAMLPVVDGLEVLRHLRRDRLTAQVPIIILTAPRQDREVLAAMALGADDYLVKPFIPDDLVVRIAKLLDKHGRSAA